MDKHTIVFDEIVLKKGICRLPFFENLLGSIARELAVGMGIDDEQKFDIINRFI